MNSILIGTDVMKANKPKSWTHWRLSLKCFKEYGLGEEESDNLGSWTLCKVVGGRKMFGSPYISKFVSEHDIPQDPVLNLDQTLLS